jgi:hypothetical protein
MFQELLRKNQAPPAAERTVIPSRSRWPLLALAALAGALVFRYFFLP